MVAPVCADRQKALGKMGNVVLPAVQQGTELVEVGGELCNERKFKNAFNYSIQNSPELPAFQPRCAHLGKLTNCLLMSRGFRFPSSPLFRTINWRRGMAEKLAPERHTFLSLKF